MSVAGLHRHLLQGRIVRKIMRPLPRTIEAFRGCYTGFALDLMGKYGSMCRPLLPLSPGMRVCGPAVTSLGPDLTVRRMAIDLSQSGDVLVVAAGGVRDYACFGDGTAKRMLLKQIAGVVIDGCTRDAAGIRRLGFPTFSLGVTPRNYHYPAGGDHGAVNVPVVCGGALVNPGDLVLGDDDGVVVVPREVADATAARMEELLRKECQERAEMTEYIPFSLEDDLLQRGYRFE